MAKDEESWRVLLARQFSVGVNADNRVMLKFDYKDIPKDTREFQLALSLPFATARELARQILEAADKAQAAARQ
jgi:hypothetical protein